MIIAVPDAEYVERLAQYVRHSSYADGWQVIACTSVQSLRQLIEHSHPVHLIVVHDSFEFQLPEQQQHIVHVRLVGPTNRVVTTSDVLQYQPLSALLFDINKIFYLAQQRQHVSAGHKFTQILTICSAQGGIGKTSIAIECAQQSANNGKRVFYLNVELWNSSVAWLDDEKTDDLSVLLYCLHVDSNKARDQFIHAKKHHATFSIDYLPASKHVRERMEMTAIQFQLLLQVIVQTELYDVVIVDTDCSFDEVWRASLLHATNIVWLTERDERPPTKTTLVQEEFPQLFGEEVEHIRAKIWSLSTKPIHTKLDRRTIANQIVNRLGEVGMSP